MVGLVRGDEKVVGGWALMGAEMGLVTGALASPVSRGVRGVLVGAGVVILLFQSRNDL